MTAPFPFDAWAKPGKDAFKFWISFFPTAPIFGVEWRFAEMVNPSVAPLMQAGPLPFPMPFPGTRAAGAAARPGEMATPAQADVADAQPIARTAAAAGDAALGAARVVSEAGKAAAGTAGAAASTSADAARDATTAVAESVAAARPDAAERNAAEPAPRPSSDAAGTARTATSPVVNAPTAPAVLASAPAAAQPAAEATRTAGDKAAPTAPVVVVAAPQAASNDPARADQGGEKSNKLAEPVESIAARAAQSVASGATTRTTPASGAERTGGMQPVEPQAVRKTGDEARPAAARAGEAMSGLVDAAIAAAPRPAVLLDKKPDNADDLTMLKGVGAGLARQLNGLGIWKLEQVARMSQADLAWVDANLTSFKGRCFRDDWIGQAKARLAR